MLNIEALLAMIGAGRAENEQNSVKRIVPSNFLARLDIFAGGDEGDAGGGIVRGAGAAAGWFRPDAHRRARDRGARLNAAAARRG